MRGDDALANLPTPEECPRPHLLVADAAPDDPDGRPLLTVKAWGETVLTRRVADEAELSAAFNEARDEIARRCQSAGPAGGGVNHAPY